MNRLIATKEDGFFVLRVYRADGTQIESVVAANPQDIVDEVRDNWPAGTKIEWDTRRPAAAPSAEHIWLRQIPVGARL